METKTKDTLSEKDTILLSNFYESFDDLQDTNINRFKILSNISKNLYNNFLKENGYSFTSVTSCIVPKHSNKFICLKPILTGSNKRHSLDICEYCVDAPYITCFDHAKLIKRHRKVIGMISSPYKLNINDLYKLEKKVKNIGLKLKISTFSNYTPLRTPLLGIFKKDYPFYEIFPSFYN